MICKFVGYGILIALAAGIFTFIASDFGMAKTALVIVGALIIACLIAAAVSLLY